MNKINSYKIIVIAAVCLLLHACGGKEAREQSYLSKAENFFAEDNYSKSKIEAKNVLQINPKNPNAMFLLGKIQLKEGELHQAFKNFNNAIEENPDYSAAHVEVAKIYFAADQLDNAKNHTDKVLSIEPDNKDARVLLAGIYSKTEETDKAIKIAESILKEYPADLGSITVLTPIYGKESPEKALQLVDTGLQYKPDNILLKELKIRVLVALDRTEEIESILVAIIQQHPDDIDYAYKLSQYYLSQNRIEDAENSLRDFVEYNPNNIDAKTILIDFLSDQNNVKKTETTLEKFIAENPDEYKLKQLLVSFYVKNNENHKAEKLLKTIIQNSDKQYTTMAASNTLANLYFIENKHTRSEQLITTVLALDPVNTEALILSARIKLSKGKNKDAIADLRAALKNNGDAVEAIKLLALAQQRENLLDLAIDNYRRIISLLPNDLDAWQEAGSISYQQNNMTQAKAFLNHVVSEQPKNQTALSMITTILGSEGNWSRAHDLLNPLIQDKNTTAIGLTLKARLFTQQNEWQKAARLYKKVLAVNPESYEAVAGYAQSLQRQDRTQAMAFLKDHIQKHAKMHAAKDLLATLYIEDEQLNDAVGLYQKIIEQSPQIELAYQKLAAVYERQGKLNEAQKIYNDAISNNPNFHTLRLYLAGFYERQNDYVAAIEHYEMLLKRESESDIVKNNLAVLLINHFSTVEDYQRALNLASSIDDQQNPNYMNTIGWAHYQLGNISQAISYLQVAVNRDQDNEEFRYHLGMAYHKNGELQKAKQELLLATSNEEASYIGISKAKKTLQLL